MMPHTPTFDRLLGYAKSGKSGNGLLATINLDLGRNTSPFISEVEPLLYHGFSNRGRMLDFINGNDFYGDTKFGVGVFATYDKSMAESYAGPGALMSFNIDSNHVSISDTRASRALQDLVESFADDGHDEQSIGLIYNTFKRSGLNAAVFGYDAVTLGNGNVLVLNKECMMINNDFRKVEKIVTFSGFLEQSGDSFTDYPQSATDSAKKAIAWKDEYGAAVKAGTRVGWARANQLANREPLSLKTLKRIKSFFDRHQKNKKINPKYKDEPWRDKGYVSWQTWGGDSMYSWVKKKLKSLEE